MKKVLLFGPYSPPTTGQSLAFRSVVDSFTESEYELVDYSRFGNRVLGTLYAILKSSWLLLTKRNIESIYFTCSRSVFGCLKDIPLLLIGGVLKKNIINHLHGADFASFYSNTSGILRFLLTKGYQRVDTSIVLTESMRNEFVAFRGMNVEVVSNFYPSDFDKFEFVENEETVVTYFSNLMRSKGILEFLDAADIVSQSFKEVKFVIAGSYMADYLMTEHEIRMAVEKFISSHPHINLEYVGKVSPNDRLEFLGKSEIFVLPTYYTTEGFPLSILEAMRCGNVIISTKHNYLPEILSVSNGRLVEPKNSGKLASAIGVFLKDKNLTKKTQLYNIEEAKSKYSETKYTTYIKQIIQG